MSDAVECAVEAQDALKTNATSVAAEKRVQFRIGIHLGDVTQTGMTCWAMG